MSYVSVLIVFSFASRQTIFKAMKETPYFLPFHSVQTYRDLPFWYFKSVISRCKSSTWGTTPRLMFWRHFWSRTNFLCFCMCLSPTIIIFVSISIIKALLDSSRSKLSELYFSTQPDRNPRLLANFYWSSCKLWFFMASSSYLPNARPQISCNFNLNPHNPIYCTNPVHPFMHLPM